jgi:hypothetical protein
MYIAIREDTYSGAKDVVMVDDIAGLKEEWEEDSVEGWEFYEATPVTVTRKVNISIRKSK